MIRLAVLGFSVASLLGWLRWVTMSAQPYSEATEEPNYRITADPKNKATEKPKTAQKSLLPESAGDVFPLPFCCSLVEPLVGGGLAERSEMSEVRAELDVVEEALVDERREACASAVPCHLELRMVLSEVLCQSAHFGRVGVASHEGDAGDVALVAADERVEFVGRERRASVFPQVLAVASGASAGTGGDVDGEADLVGHFLKDDSCIDVFEHGNDVLFVREELGS